MYKEQKNSEREQARFIKDRSRLVQLRDCHSYAHVALQDYAASWEDPLKHNYTSSETDSFCHNIPKAQGVIGTCQILTAKAIISSINNYQQQ